MQGSSVRNIFDWSDGFPRRWEPPRQERKDGRDSDLFIHDALRVPTYNHSMILDYLPSVKYCTGPVLILYGESKNAKVKKALTHHY